jgi:hypothetical protein
MSASITLQALLRVNLGRLIPGKPGQYLSNPSTAGTYLTATSFGLSLKLKRLPYTTVRPEHPNIERLCKKIGANATSYNSDRNPHFTGPVIRDASTNTVVSDSIEIARYLDQTYPWKGFRTYFSSQKIKGCILAESGRRVWESRRMTWKE